MCSMTEVLISSVKLHRDRSINYSWVTLQSVFLAGLSFIYAGKMGQIYS